MEASPAKRRVLGELNVNAASPAPRSPTPAKRDVLVKPHQPLSIAALTASRSPSAKRSRETAGATTVERGQENQPLPTAKVATRVPELGGADDERPAKKPCLVPATVDAAATSAAAAAAVATAILERQVRI